MINLQLETTSTCNAKCAFCIYPQAARWGGKMDMDLFRSIIDQTVDIPEITRFTLHGLGEPLLDPELENRINYAKNVNPLPISIYTNGVYLTPERFTGLKASGIDTIVVSLNAIYPEQHEKIMGLKDKFETVCRNIENVIEDGIIDIRVHAVATGDTFTLADTRQFNARWGEYARCVIEGNWGGDIVAKRQFQPNDCCFRAINHIYVMYNGVITACCFDPTGTIQFGNLTSQTIKDVYNSDAYAQFREDHYNNRADKYSICKGCTRI